MECKGDCSRLLEPISEYISGDAADTLCREIQAHLAECADCRVVVDTIRKTIMLCRSGAAEDLPHDVRQRLYQRLDLGEYLVDAGDQI